MTDGQTVRAEDLPDAVTITDGIVAVIDRALDWRVYEETAIGGAYRLIDVQPSLRAVRRRYDPDTFPTD